MISDREQGPTDRQAYDGMIKRNTKLFEHVIQKVHDPKMISDVNLTMETHIRFNYEGVRFIVYHSGYVTIAETAVEIGGRIEAQLMERLLDIRGKGVNDSDDV